MSDFSEFKAGDRWADNDGDVHTIIGTYNGRVVTHMGGRHGVGTWSVELFKRGRKLPSKRVLYFNVYPDDPHHESRAVADSKAHTDRVACVRVEFEEGQFDD